MFHCLFVVMKAVILSPLFVVMKAVILSPLFVDESAAIAAATGIKVLIDCLSSTCNDPTRFFIADCLGRLAHTRAGQNQIYLYIITGSPHHAHYNF